MIARLLRLGAALLVVFTVVGVGAPAAHAATASILGGGSGFAALEIDQWRADTAREPFNLTINYVGQGSTFGRVQFAKNLFDYGATDIQYPPLELVPGADLLTGRCAGKAIDDSCFVYVPVSAGGLSFMYNLTDGSGNRISNLQLTRRAVCKIFTGEINNWDDPEIVANNPELASYDHPIKQIVRADGAGESYVLSEFCIAVAPDVWHAFVTSQAQTQDNNSHLADFLAGQPVSSWPATGWGNAIAVGSADSTANAVADPLGGPDAITYVAAGYSKVRSFPTASVQNAAGLFTQPDETNVTVALAYATGRPNGTFQLAFNGADPRSYFPSTYSYVLAQTAGFDPSKGATLAQFLCYAVSKGQASAPQLRYARLSSELVNIAIGAIVKIPGAPSAANCPVAGAPPPPPPVQVCTSNCPVPPGSTPPPGSNNNNNGQNPTTGTLPNDRPVSSTPGHTTTGTTPSGAPCTAATKPTKSKSKATTTTTAKATTTTTVRHSTTTAHPTTTTTVPCAPTNVGDTNVVGVGGANAIVTTTTESLDAQLASQKGGADPTGSSHGASIWLMLAGVCITGAATAVWGRRKTTP